jgi:hypothetical protein
MTEAQNDPVPAGQVRIENISLEEFESLVYRHQYEAAGALLLKNLRKLKAGAEFIGYPIDQRVKPVLYSRFAAAIVALLVDDKFSVSTDGFDFIASEHAITDLLFRGSIFETSDHMLPQLAQNPGEIDRNKLRLKDGPGIAKFLMTYSLRSSFALNFEQTFKRSPQQFVSLWAGMLSALLTVASQAHQRRELISSLHAIFADTIISDAAMPTLSDAYMYTSYGTSKTKHDAKATIHRIFSNKMRRHDVVIPTADELKARRLLSLSKHERKPVMLVGIEWFTSLHAMYRCYAPVIRQLRKRFHVVAMCRPSDIDEQGKAEFDEWHAIDQENIMMSDIAKRVNAIAPDIIYYPSVGMALWWVAMASERFAPIQVMSLGHPASSRSPVMDYVLCDEGAVGDASLFTEKLITYPDFSARFVMRPDAMFPELITEDDAEVVNIAIPAMLCKLNAPFLSTLRDIEQGTKKKVRFHFFVNMMGLNLFQTAREIRDWLPDALVYERAHYNAYLERLRTCCLHLSTFPFGGTNSNIDSFLLGIPVLTLEGLEPHERFDAMMIRRAGIDEFFIAQTREDYVAKAIQLIEDADMRNAHREFLRGLDLQDIFFGAPPAGQESAIEDAMWAIYCDHEDMQASAAAVISSTSWVEESSRADDMSNRND